MQKLHPRLKEAVKELFHTKEELYKYVNKVVIPIVDGELKNSNEVEIDADYPIPWVYNHGCFEKFEDKPISERLEIEAKKLGFGFDGERCWVATIACAELLGITGEYKVTHEWDGYNYIVVSKSKKTKLVSLDEIAREIYGRI